MPNIHMLFHRDFRLASFTLFHRTYKPYAMHLGLFFWQKHECEIKQLFEDIYTVLVANNNNYYNVVLRGSKDQDTFILGLCWLACHLWFGVFKIWRTKIFKEFVFLSLSLTAPPPQLIAKSCSHAQAKKNLLRLAWSDYKGKLSSGDNLTQYAEIVIGHF